jgi:hypothetical protein
LIGICVWGETRKASGVREREQEEEEEVDVRWQTHMCCEQVKRLTGGAFFYWVERWQCVAAVLAVGVVWGGLGQKGWRRRRGGEK